MQGEVRIMDRTGHTTLAWDTEVQTQNRDPGRGPLDPAFVEEEFARLVGEGHLAFREVPKPGGGTESVQMRKGATLKPEEGGKVTLVPPFVGG